VEKALAEFTHSYPETFSKDSRHGFHVYQSKHIELWQGDFLKLPREELPQIDAIYDKAAMIALPERMRASYAKKILAFCQDNTQMMLQTFEYDQSEMSGPPFSVLQREVELHFSEHFEITLLHEQSKFDELDKFQQRGLSTYLNEKIYHLKPLK
jgi:thiopurine S-methyltransferase